MLLIVKVMTKLARFVLHFQMKQSKMGGGGGGEMQRGGWQLTCYDFRPTKQLTRHASLWCVSWCERLSTSCQLCNAPWRLRPTAWMIRLDKKGLDDLCHAMQFSRVWFWHWISLTEKYQKWGRCQVEVGGGGGRGGRARMSLELKVKKGEGFDQLASFSFNFYLLLWVASHYFFEM